MVGVWESFTVLPCPCAILSLIFSLPPRFSFRYFSTRLYSLLESLTRDFIGLPALTKVQLQLPSITFKLYCSSGSVLHTRQSEREQPLV